MRCKLLRSMIPWHGRLSVSRFVRQSVCHASNVSVPTHSPDGATSMRPITTLLYSHLLTTGLKLVHTVYTLCCVQPVCWRCLTTTKSQCLSELTGMALQRTSRDDVVLRRTANVVLSDQLTAPQLLATTTTTTTWWIVAVSAFC